MKTRFLYKFFIAASLATVSMLMLASCEKNELRLSNNQDPTGMAFFKLAWMSPATNTQGVQLKINGERLSNQLGLGAAFTSTTQYAMPFPGGGLNTGGNNKSDYLAVAPGSLSISLSIPKVGTSTDSIVVLAPTTITVEANKYATFIVTDSFPAATSYLVADDVEFADSGYFKLRLTNAIPNAGPLDFLMTNTRVTDSLVVGGLDYKKATDFLKLPYVAGTVSFKLRKTGTTTVVNTTIYATSSLTNKRVFTCVARGYVGGTGTKLPTISYIFNK
jgi:hypothetical protein